MLCRIHSVSDLPRWFSVPLGGSLFGVSHRLLLVACLAAVAWGATAAAGAKAKADEALSKVIQSDIMRTLFVRSGTGLVPGVARP